MNVCSTLDWIRSCITPEYLEKYNSAQPGEKLGLYADSSVKFGASVGREEDPEDRPVAILFPVAETVDTSGLSWLLYAEFIRESMHVFSIAGYEAIERTVRAGSQTSSRINLPPDWRGKRVLVVRVE